jgi:hypothetical protein
VAHEKMLESQKLPTTITIKDPFEMLSRVVGLATLPICASHKSTNPSIHLNLLLTYYTMIASNEGK